MKVILLIVCVLFSSLAFGQFTKPQLYSNINTNIRLKTASQLRTAAVLDSIVKSMSLVGGGSMVYPGAGIPLSTGSAWGTSITDNSANWNTAFGWGNHAGQYWKIAGTTQLTTSGSGFTDNVIVGIGPIATGNYYANQQFYRDIDNNNIRFNFDATGVYSGVNTAYSRGGFEVFDGAERFWVETKGAGTGNEKTLYFAMGQDGIFFNRFGKSLLYLDAITDKVKISDSYNLPILAGSDGSFLRSDGAGESLWSTVTLPATMSALGLWVANSANTTVNLTAAANQSIRVNSGGTAWEAYTLFGVTNLSTTTLSVTSTSGDQVILVDAATAGGTVTITLPTAVGNQAKIHVKKIDSGSNTVVVDGNLAETVDGISAATIYFQYQSITLVSNGTSWFII